MSSKPLLSFCIPTYNRSRLVHKCVTHILRHPSHEIEVVVSDNASPDDTLDKLASIADPRLCFSSNRTNLGFGGNFVAALKLGKGRFCLELSDEDSVYLDRIDQALEFLRGVEPDCAVVRFSMDGVFTSFKSSYGYRSPPGPEACLFAFLNCGDVAGSAFNHDLVVDGIDTARYPVVNSLRDDLYPGGYPLIDILMRPTLRHPAVYSPIVLINRGFNADSYDEMTARANHEDKEALDTVSCSPLFLRSFFAPACKTVGAMYDGAAQEDALYGWLIKIVASYHAYVPAISIFTHNGDWLDLKIRDKNWINLFFAKYGDPWEIGRITMFDCLEHLQERTGKSIWRAVDAICREFFAGNLEAPVRGYNFAEKFVAGDLLCMMGVDATRHGYFPDTKSAFVGAEFKETDKLYRLFHSGKYESLLAFPELRTARAQFFLGAAHFLHGDLTRAELRLRRHLDCFANAECVGDIIYGQQTIIQAHYLLGCIHHQRREYAKAADAFAAAKSLADFFVLGFYLTRDRLGSFIPDKNGAR